MAGKVLITDYAWPSLETEREILASAGAVIVPAKTGCEEELLELAPEVDGILTCWKPVRECVIQRATRCLCIGRYGIGLDNIDVHCATRLGIVVTNVPSYCIEEVSDHAMALMLACARKVVLFDRAAKAGLYDIQAHSPLFRIRGKVLGLVGFGKIARAVCRKALGFGLQVLFYDPYVEPGSVPERAVGVSFQELLRRSDFVSIHAPLTPDSRYLFNEAAMQQMKPTAYLINTSRGLIIDNEALLRALEEGRVAGAALDVLATEPPNPDDPVLRHPKIIMTPHAAFSSVEALDELQRTAAEQMAVLLTGQLPNNVVNPEVLQNSNLRARLAGRMKSGE